MADGYSLVLIEVANLAPAFLVADHCAKSAAVHLMGIESTDGSEQCIKLVGPAGDVELAAQSAADIAERMGSKAFVSTMAAPLEATRQLADTPPVYSPLLGLYDYRVPRKDAMTTQDALGLLETQGLVAALHATDDMLKSSNVTLVGKEKIGAAYVTIMVRGDVAAVQTAVATGKQTVERLGGKLILADVIARPHPELAALLPK
ncbi:MAG: BMC domain-containing protein [Planctomycetaceae bacterium]